MKFLITSVKIFLVDYIISTLTNRNVVFLFTVHSSTGGGGQQFTGDSDSPMSIVPHLKLTSVLILKVPYSIKKCATCLDTFLRF